jgi:hypothetical protein
VRVILAGLCVFGILLLTAGLLSSVPSVASLPAPIVGIATALVMVAASFGVLWLFNRPGTDPLGRKSPEEFIRELEEQSLLTSTTYRATRAFGVEEYEDEGSHYFLELVDGRVLFMSGQYLYDYEPYDEPGSRHVRRFPCTEFTVRRHSRENYVVDLRCEGTVLEPELVAPSFGPDVWRAGVVPEDGQILADRSYETIRRESEGRSLTRS